MQYTVEVTPAAGRQIRKLDRSTQKRILARIEKLEEEPRPRDASKLQSPEELYRIRVGTIGSSIKLKTTGWSF
ncbi:MAG TPA: type II toxin-antitoxin system RelE/ParE family toxin [Thermoanaerobaculia bacterium]|nr:type II toxin-antitoxin system RelE/ParE family toxin [Thermoanaerobaculia bacterium]